MLVSLIMHKLVTKCKMKPQVSIIRAEKSLEDAVREAVNLLGGIDRFIKPDGSYLIKPNLFTTIPSEKGATTDLRIFMTLARMIKEKNARPVVGECPATASYARPDIVFDNLGVREICQKEDVAINVLDREEPVRVKNPSAEVLDNFWFPKFSLDCEGIINVPKLKTHSLTKMTCAVKNLFGLQQGGSKANHHVRTGNDPESFNRLLVDLYGCIHDKVILNVVDAVVAMEGEGPTTGDPVKLYVIIAGEDAAAVDFVSAAVMGWDPLEVGTNYLLAERGLGPKTLDEVEVVGVPIEKVVRPFKRPQTHSDGQMFIDIQMPIVCDPEKCESCGICVQTCPVKAISMNNIPEFNDSICIQCFCCMELCPHGAIRVVREEN